MAAGPNAFVACEAVDAQQFSGPIESWASGVLSGGWTEVNRVASNLGNPVAVDVTRQAAYIAPDDLDVARPQQLLTRLGYPLARRVQRRFAGDSAAAMRRAVAQDKPRLP